MNILLITGLVLFAGVFVVFYLLFITNTITTPEPPKEIPVDDAIERCKSLFEQNLHAELQRYAQKELAKNYGNIELRRILAESFMASNKTDMAIMHYEAILSIAPYDIKTQELLAQYYCENGPKKRAIELYEQIFMYDSGNVNAVETLSNLYIETQDYEKAIEMYEMMEGAESDESKIEELRYTLADLYIKTNNNEKAYRAYEQVLQNSPDNLEILILVADLAYKTGYLQDCLKYYNQIISIVGDDFEILEKIAQIHMQLENWDDAVEAYKKLISLEDEDSLNFLYHQNELATALIRAKRSYEAIDRLKELMSKYPKETSFAFTLAQAYAIVGEFKTGLAIYNKLLEEIPPEQSDIIIRYISTVICTWAKDLFEKGEYNQAFDKFFEALKYNEENDEIYFELGKCNYKIKSFQDSIAHFKRAISIKPQESRYYFALGCAYDESGNIKQAKASFKDSLNIDPLNTQARIAYAISLTKELEYAQSIEQFNEVLKQIPDNADTIYNLALAYELVGDIERAIKHYKQALDIEPKHKEAKHNLELILGEPYIIEGEEPVEEEIIETETETEEKE